MRSEYSKSVKQQGKNMLLTFNPFNQPATNQIVEVQIIGKPTYFRTTIFRFIKYGVYSVNEIIGQTDLVSTYRLRLLERYVNSPATVPSGTVAYIEEEDLTTSTLPYSSTIFLDFRGTDYQSVNLDGDITFATQQQRPGRAIVVKIRNLSGTVSRNVSFPSSWIFIGSAGRPSTIGPSKTAILSITSFEYSDADVIAAWGVQPG